MRRLGFIFTLLSLPLAAQTPYGRLQFQLQTAQGQAVSGATVNVYTQSACGAPASITPAALFADANGTTPIQQPVITDGFGQGAAYAAQGCYTVVYYSGYTGTITLVDQNAIAATNVSPVGGASLPLAGGTLIGPLTSTVIPAVGSYHVAAFGDSLTQGVGATTSYPAALTSNIGVSVSNLGSCGQTALQIAIRTGALPTTVTVVGGSIPTSGNVQVTFSTASPVDSCNGPSVISTITGAGGVVVPGTLSETSGQDFFTPSTYPAAPLTVAPGSPWAPVIGERFLGYMIIWAGRNGIGNATNLSSIAAIAAMATDKKKTLVLSVENIDVPSEYIGQADYITITTMNSNLQAAYSGNATYPDNYFDIRAYLVSQYDPTNPQDVIDHGHDVPPSSLRPVKPSTFLGDVTTTSQTAILVNNTDMSTIITATGEKMEIVSFSGSSSPFTATVIRGYAGTTPSTYLNGDSFQFIEPLHYSDAGYALIAGQVYNWLRAHSTPISPLSGMFDLLHELPLSGSANAVITTAPRAVDLNLQTTWPWVGWGDGTTLNTPGPGTWYVVTTGLACCTGKYASQLATNLTTGSLSSRSLNNGNWGAWTAGLSIGAVSGVGPVTANLNAQTTWPWVGWADNTTLNTPGSGSWLVSTTGLGCCAGYVAQMATGLTTGLLYTRAENNGVWGTWVRPTSVPAVTVVGNVPNFGNTTGDLTGTPYSASNPIPASIAPGAAAPTGPLFYSLAGTKTTAMSAPAQNATKLASFYFPGPGTTTLRTLLVNVTTADNSASLYDIGVYGPGCVANATNIPLAEHIGATAGSAINAGIAGSVALTVAGSPVAGVAPGWYCLASTSNGATPAMVLGSDANGRLAQFAVGSSPAGITGTTTGGVLNSTITAPTGPTINGAATPWVFSY